MSTKVAQLEDEMLRAEAAIGTPLCCGIIYDVERGDVMLVWNPRAGYTCSACSWTKRVHIQDRLPEEDELAEAVRKEFADHVREKHPQKQRSEHRY